MNDLAYIEAEITFLSKSEGGRDNPPPHLSDCGYRPHLVVGDPKQRKAITIGNVIQETYLSIAFLSGPENAQPNETFTAELVLIGWPNPVYHSLIPEATFTIREGVSIVGYGKVKSLPLRWVRNSETAD